jgi:hypothetical protein
MNLAGIEHNTDFVDQAGAEQCAVQRSTAVGAHFVVEYDAGNHMG